MEVRDLFFCVRAYVVGACSKGRSSHQKCSIKNIVLRNFAKFTDKQLLQSNKVASLWPANLLKKRLWHRCFPLILRSFQEHRFYRAPPDD